MTTLEQRLKALDLSVLPVWVYDHGLLKFQWANDAALELWRAKSREELLARDFSDSSASTRTRLEGYLRAIEQGGRVEEDWTLYPRGVPTTMVLHGSGVTLDDGRLAILFQATVKAPGLDASMVRGVEAVRHSSMMISLLDEGGSALFHNPAAQRAFGDDVAFADRFKKSDIAQAMRDALLAGEVYTGEILVQAGEEARVHEVEARRTTDPVSGKSAVLIQQVDVTDRRRAEEKTREQRDLIDELNRSLTVVEEQRAQILALSAPILDIGRDTLAIPLIGVIDAERSGELCQRLLSIVVARRARRVIFDLTGVVLPDASGAASLLDVIRAVRLMGARSLVSGIRPELAALLASFDTDLEGVLILRSLERAIDLSSKD